MFIKGFKNMFKYLTSILCFIFFSVPSVSSAVVLHSDELNPFSLRPNSSLLEMLPATVFNPYAIDAIGPGLVILSPHLKKMCIPYLDSMPTAWGSIFYRTVQEKVFQDMQGERPFNERYWLFFLHKLSRIVENLRWMDEAYIRPVQGDLPLRLSYLASATMNFYNVASNNAATDLFLFKDKKQLSAMEKFIAKVCFLRAYSFEEKQKRYSFAVKFLEKYPQCSRLCIDMIRTLTSSEDLPWNWLVYLDEYFTAIDKNGALTHMWAMDVRSILEGFNPKKENLGSPIVLIHSLCPAVRFGGIKIKQQENVPIDFLPEKIQGLLSEEESERQVLSSIESTHKFSFFKQMVDAARGITGKNEKQGRRVLKAEYLHIFFKIPKALANLQEVEEVSRRQQIEEDADQYFNSLESFKNDLLLMERMRTYLANDEASKRESLRVKYWDKVLGEYEKHESRLRDAIDTERLDFLGNCFKALKGLAFVENHSAESIVQEEFNKREDALSQESGAWASLYKQYLTKTESLKRSTIKKEQEKQYKTIMSQYAGYIEKRLVLYLLTKLPKQKQTEDVFVKNLLNHPALDENIRVIFREYLNFLENYTCNCLCPAQKAKEQAISDLFARNGRGKIHDILGELGQIIFKCNFTVFKPGYDKRYRKLINYNEYPPDIYIRRYNHFLKSGLLDDLDKIESRQYRILYLEFLIYATNIHVISRFVREEVIAPEREILAAALESQKQIDKRVKLTTRLIQQGHLKGEVCGCCGNLIPPSDE
jgi:hypothetical protein